MTAHELARQLLEMPDLLVFIPEDSDVYNVPMPYVGDAIVSTGWNGGIAAETARSNDPRAVKVIVL